MYRIRTVDADDDETAEMLGDLHRLTFFHGASMPQFDLGTWWIAYHGDDAVAFAGVVPSTHARNSGYFCRVGVLQRHWGRGLQLRLMRAIEVRARRLGWDSIVSDTTDNPVSANNFIRAGYRLHEPETPWGWSHTLYWRKWLR
ncbi:GNAT family N-acetyltransferase [Bradyrhizobium diazoefficiens]|uniref:GNAT family N-acetyltransferase n=1 Tax=Bradyrhizobium tunisiense TaxID=3278709 RepID=UPI001BA65343|nr:GNAT family N-acetyltransferase [Bradyrhizobium diazoefficiens]MBR0814934.1 GNAT family N-acetyltransferase [Bradyrhizobium diazoefficiens]